MISKRIKKILNKKGYTTSNEDSILEKRIMKIHNEMETLNDEERLIRKKLSGEEL